MRLKTCLVGELLLGSFGEILSGLLSVVKGRCYWRVDQITLS